jgi:ferritin-like metal-binding protein YciE
MALPAFLDDCTEAVVKFRDTSALDVALIAAAQVVEHYEITCYRALKAWAEHLQIQEAVDLIDESNAYSVDAFSQRTRKKARRVKAG